MELARTERTSFHLSHHSAIQPRAPLLLNYPTLLESVTARTKRDHWVLGLPKHRFFFFFFKYSLRTFGSICGDMVRLRQSPRYTVHSHFPPNRTQGSNQ